MCHVLCSYSHCFGQYYEKSTRYGREELASRGGGEENEVRDAGWLLVKETLITRVQEVTEQRVTQMCKVWYMNLLMNNCVFQRNKYQLRSLQAIVNFSIVYWHNIACPPIRNVLHNNESYRIYITIRTHRRSSDLVVEGEKRFIVKQIVFAFVMDSDSKYIQLAFR